MGSAFLRQCQGAKAVSSASDDENIICTIWCPTVVFLLHGRTGHRTRRLDIYEFASPDSGIVSEWRRHDAILAPFRTIPPPFMLKDSCQHSVYSKFLHQADRPAEFPGKFWLSNFLLNNQVASANDSASSEVSLLNSEPFYLEGFPTSCLTRSESFRLRCARVQTLALCLLAQLLGVHSSRPQ